MSDTFLSTIASGRPAILSPDIQPPSASANLPASDEPTDFLSTIASGRPALLSTGAESADTTSSADSEKSAAPADHTAESAKDNVINRFRASDASVLAEDKTLDFGELYSSKQLDSDPVARQKLIEAYAIRKQKPISMAGVIESTPGAILDTGKSFLHSAWLTAKDIAIAARHDGSMLPTPEAKAAQARLLAAGETGTADTNELLNKARSGLETMAREKPTGLISSAVHALARVGPLGILTHTPRTPSEWESELAYEAAFRGVSESSASGHGPLSTPAVSSVFGEGQSLASLAAANGSPIDPNETRLKSMIVNPVNLIPGGAALRGGEILGAGLVKSAVSSITPKLARAVEVAGNLSTKAGEALSAGGTAAVLEMAVGSTGVHGVGVAAGLVAPRVLKRVGTGLLNTADAISGQASAGPLWTLASKVAGSSVTKGAAAGIGLTGDPLALAFTGAQLVGAESDKEVAGALAGNAVIGGTAVGARKLIGKVAKAVDLERGAYGTGKGISADLTRKNIESASKPYGVSDVFDAVHADAMTRLSPEERAAIGVMREHILTPEGIQGYVVDSKNFGQAAAAILNQAAASNGVTLSDTYLQNVAQKAQNSPGVVVENFQIGDKPQRIMVLNTNSRAAPHELGHVFGGSRNTEGAIFGSLLAPEDVAQVHRAIQDNFSAKELTDFAAQYLKNEKAFNPNAVMTPEKMLNEMTAELGSVIFRGVPLDRLGMPIPLQRSIYQGLLKVFSKIGYDPGVTAELGVRRDPRVISLFENLVRSKMESRNGKVSEVDLTKVDIEPAKPVTDPVIAPQNRPDEIPPIDPTIARNVVPEGMAGRLPQAPISVSKPGASPVPAGMLGRLPGKPLSAKSTRKTDVQEPIDLPRRNAPESSQSTRPAPRSFAPESPQSTRPAPPKYNESEPSTEPAAESDLSNIRATRQDQNSFKRTSPDKTLDAAAIAVDANPAYGPAQKEAFVKLGAVIAQGGGRPVPVEIDHNSVKSEGHNIRRTDRRAEQSAGYAKEVMDQVPSDVRARVNKVFVPVRIEVLDRNNVQVVGHSLDKVIGNAYSAARLAAESNVSGLVPYETVDGKYTDSGWRSLVSDLQKYTLNQSNGVAGNGAEVRIPEGYQGDIPARNPEYVSEFIDTNKADFVNLLMALPPPKTVSFKSRTASGVPANVIARSLAEANDKPVLRSVTSTRGKDVYTTGDHIGEFNPLRDKLAKAGVPVREFVESTERINLADIEKVTPRRDLKYSGPSTDLVRAGFLPDTTAGREVPVGKTEFASAEKQSQTKVAPATYLGIQKGFDTIKDIELYNLTDDIPGHPEGSTVSRQTLELAGYTVPQVSAAFLAPQLAGKKLPGSIPDKELTLVHYGNAGQKSIDPAKFGASGSVSRNEMAGNPWSYFYERGKENKTDPAALRTDVYEIEVSGAKIYDGDADSLGYSGMLNRAKADDMLMQAGYVGIARSGKLGRTEYRQIELFQSVKTDKKNHSD